MATATSELSKYLEAIQGTWTDYIAHDELDGTIKSPSEAQCSKDVDDIFTQMGFEVQNFDSYRVLGFERLVGPQIKLPNIHAREALANDIVEALRNTTVDARAQAESTCSRIASAARAVEEDLPLADRERKANRPPAEKVPRFQEVSPASFQLH